MHTLVQIQEIATTQFSVAAVTIISLHFHHVLKGPSFFCYGTVVPNPAHFQNGLCILVEAFVHNVHYTIFLMTISPLHTCK